MEQANTKDSAAVMDALIAETALAWRPPARNDDLHGRVAALEVAVASLTRSRAPDVRLGRVLTEIHAYVRTASWSASELIEDARIGDPALWLALDDIVGERSPAIALGRFLAAHVGCDADGFRLAAAGMEEGVRRYLVESTPTDSL